MLSIPHGGSYFCFKANAAWHNLSVPRSPMPQFEWPRNVCYIIELQDGANERLSLGYYGYQHFGEVSRFHCHGGLINRHEDVTSTFHRNAESLL